MNFKKTKFYFIIFFIVLSFLFFSSESVLAKEGDACFNPSKPEISGICQTFSCDEGSVTISNTRCSENLFATTCCSVPSNQKTQTTTSATITAKPATTTTTVPATRSTSTDECVGINAEKGTCNVLCPGDTVNVGDRDKDCSWVSRCCGIIAKKTTVTSIDGLKSTKVESGISNATTMSKDELDEANTQIARDKIASAFGVEKIATTSEIFSSQCKGFAGTVEINCSHDNDINILQKQCAPLLKSSNCLTMTTYLGALSEKCKFIKYSSGYNGDCDLIAKNGVYGAEASKFSSFLIDTIKNSGISSGAGNLGSYSSASEEGSSVGTGILDLPTGVGLPDPAGGIKEILTNLLKWFLGIVGIVAMIAFVVSGVQYFLVSADEKMATDAKKNMTFAIIGIIVALSGFVIIKAIDTALNAKGLF